MTNALGVPAIRRYYEAPLQGFPYRRVALDAFAAGHDLIYLDQLSADNFWDTEREYIKDIVLFFRERYTADPNFQIQVDDAVRRILQLKFHLYHNSANAFTEDYKLTITDSEPAPAGQTLVPLHNVLVPRERLTIFEDTSAHRQQALAIVGQVARETVSVLYPELANLSEVIPAAPQSTDRLLIFSDSRLFSECADCTAETMLGPDELKGIITRLYGSDPGATGQLSPDNIHDRSFVELAAFLNATADTPVAEPPDAASVAGAAPITTTAPLTTETAILGRAVTETPATGIVTTPASVTAQPNLEVAATPVTGEEADNGQEQRTTGVTPNERLQTLINESNWIIFAMLDVDSTRSPGSDVVKQFLRQQSERLGDKKIVVLALNAPYFLDATEISKLTAYLGVYSKTQPFLESAVRAIFRSYTPTGAPAVSVPGTRFGNLEERLQPDPNFALPLTIISNDAPIEFSPDTNVAAPVLPVGALIRLQVDQVLDHNGHPVPDGVPVIFQLTYENEMTVPVEPVLTRNGSAMREIVLEQTGRLIISASAGEAQAAAPVILRVQDPVAEATAAAVAATPIVADGTTLPTATIALTATNGAPPAGETGPTELPPTLTSDWANWGYPDHCATNDHGDTESAAHFADPHSAARDVSQ
ncbi:MAG: hypothetical protein R2867_30060 [Caldilineaceae bacterium]